MKLAIFILLLLCSPLLAKDHEFLIYRDQGQLHLLTYDGEDYAEWNHLIPFSFKDYGSNLTVWEGSYQFGIEMTFQIPNKWLVGIWGMTQSRKNGAVQVYMYFMNHEKDKQTTVYQNLAEAMQKSYVVHVLMHVAKQPDYLPTLAAIKYSAFGERPTVTPALDHHLRNLIAQCNSPRPSERRAASVALEPYFMLMPHYIQTIVLTPEQQIRLRAVYGKCRPILSPVMLTAAKRYVHSDFQEILLW